MPVPQLLEKVQLLFNLAGELDGLSAVVAQAEPDVGSELQSASESLMRAGRIWARHIATQYLKYATPDNHAKPALPNGQKSELHFGIVSPLTSVEKLLEVCAENSSLREYATPALERLEGVRAEALLYIGEHERAMAPIVADPAIRRDLPIMFGDILAESV